MRAVAEVHAIGGQPLPQLPENFLPACAGQVHFIDEQKHRNMISVQHPPDGFRMRLHTVRSADHQHRIIQHRHYPLHFRGKIRVTGGIQQGYPGLLRGKPGLLGKNGNAPRPLQTMGIQIGVLMVHPPQFLNGSGGIKHGLG